MDKATRTDPMTIRDEVAALKRARIVETAADLFYKNRKRRKFDTQLTSLLRDGKATGEFSIGDEHVAARSIGGMVSWAYVWFRDGGRMSVEEVSQETSTLILNLVNAKR